MLEAVAVLLLFGALAYAWLSRIALRPVALRSVETFSNQSRTFKASKLCNFP